MTPRQALRLLAEDSDDLAVISAALQDAVTRIGDISWEKGARRLTIAFSRFRWEAAGDKGERVFAGFQLGGVESVRARNVRLEAKDAVLELLAVTFEPAHSADAPRRRSCRNIIGDLRTPRFLTQDAPAPPMCKEASFCPRRMRPKEKRPRYAQSPSRYRAGLRSGARPFEMTGKYRGRLTAVAARGTICR